MMIIEITPQTVITAAAAIGALAALIGYSKRAFGWFQKQQKQDEDIAAIKAEQQLLTYGVLACLKGLKEAGCNGPVSDAINTIEKHINKEAHKT